MASRLVAAAASSSSSPLARLISCRRLAEHHGPAKVNLWEDPMHPGNWKEEHFVIASLTMWGVVFYGAFKFFGNIAKKKPEAATEQAH